MLAIGLLILRLIVGLTVAAHGAQKLFGWFAGPRLSGFGGMLQKMGVWPAPVLALLTGLGEFLGGLGIAAGLLTPLAGLAVAGVMAVAIVMVHWSKGFWNRAGGLEFPLVILGAALGVSLAGPGAYSLDRLFGIALPEPATWLAMAVLVIAGVAWSIASPRIRVTASRRVEAR